MPGGSVRPRGRTRGWEGLRVPSVVVPVLRVCCELGWWGSAWEQGLVGVSGGQILPWCGGCVPGGRSGGWWQHQEHQSPW